MDFWQKRVEYALEHADLDLSANPDIGIRMLGERLEIPSPLKIVRECNALFVFVPRVHILENAVHIELGAVGTHPCSLYGRKGNVRFSCFGLEKADGECPPWRETGKAYVKMSPDVLSSELEKLFHGRAEGTILRHVDVRKVHGDLYVLSFGEIIEICAKYSHGKVELLAGSHGPDVVVRTEDPKVLGTFEKCGVL